MLCTPGRASEEKATAALKNLLKLGGLKVKAKFVRKRRRSVFLIVSILISRKLIMFSCAKCCLKVSEVRVGGLGEKLSEGWLGGESLKNRIFFFFLFGFLILTTT